MSETTAPIETPQWLLDHPLKALRLPTMLREYDRVARQCAAEDIDDPRYLLRVAELELLDRERRATERRIQQAKFPVTKSLDSFDFLAMQRERAAARQQRDGQNAHRAGAWARRLPARPPRPLHHRRRPGP